MSSSANGVSADHAYAARIGGTLDERLRQLPQLVRELDEDLLFALSLGSKELFHTNLLGWLAEHDRAVGDALLRLWGDPEAPLTPVRARREWYHLDLVLDDPAPGDHRGPARVVVENKMFALPDLVQLREYGKTVRKRVHGSPSLILLSLVDPGWLGGSWDDGHGNVWRHCSYRTLVGALEPVALAPDVDPFVGATLTKWKGMLDRLDRLTALVGRPEPDEPFQLPRPVRNTLGSVRLDGSVQKLRAHHLAGRLRRELSDLNHVKINAGLTNGVGLVEAFVPVCDGVEAGWQLQGNDWRMAIRVTEGHSLHGRETTKIAGRARLAEQSGWATFDQSPFNQPPFAGLTPGPTRNGAPTYGRFSPDFTYRYLRLPEISLREATTAGVEIIRRAAAARNPSKGYGDWSLGSMAD